MNITECNKCGQVKDITHVKISFGYGGIYDGENWQLDLCDDCLKEFKENELHNIKISEMDKVVFTKEVSV